MGVVIDALEVLKENKLRSATLYYAHPNGKLLNPGGDLADSRGMILSAGGKQYQEIVEKADFVARFSHVGKEQTGTPATLFRKLKFPPEPVKTHERLKNILIDKCSQLPKDSRNIIVLEVSEQFMLSDFTVAATASRPIPCCETDYRQLGKNKRDAIPSAASNATGQAQIPAWLADSAASPSPRRDAFQFHKSG